jgi:hypothetical protein
LLVANRGTWEVLDRRHGHLWRLKPGGGTVRSHSQLPRDLSCIYVRAAVVLRDGDRLILYGRRAHEARSSLRWTLAIIDESNATRWSDAPVDILGTRFTPWSVAELPGGVLVLGLTAYGNARGNAEGGGLARFDPLSGEACWIWRPGPSELRAPASLSLTPKGTLLVADSDLHHVSEISLEGRVLWRYGTTGVPGTDPGKLRAPEDCVSTEAGVLIADTMNDRVLEVDRDGRNIWSFGRPLRPMGPQADWPLADPRSVRRLASGNILVADTGNGRVIEVTREGAIAACWGRRQVGSRLFSFPRTVERRPGARWLVTDGNHHRVVELDRDAAVCWQYGDGLPGVGERLHWPRCARTMSSGRILIADGINGRILEVDTAARIHREVHVLRLQSGVEVALQDPHDVHELPGGHLLCVDSQLHAVLEIDRNDQVAWCYGLDNRGEWTHALIDPHQAIRTEDSSTAITDAFNHRILWVDQAGGVERVIHRLVDACGREHPVVKPRPLARHGPFLATADDHGAVLVVPLNAAGNANPNDLFRYDSTLVRKQSPAEWSLQNPAGL